MKRGFTLLELSIVLSVGAVLIPIAWMSVRTLEASHHEALAKASAARQMRSFSDSLRADLNTHAPAAPGVVLESTGPCTRISYVLEEDVVHRRGEGDCGPARPVASKVSRLERTATGLRVVFAQRTGGAKASETAFELAWSNEVPR